METTEITDFDSKSSNVYLDLDSGRSTDWRRSHEEVKNVIFFVN